VSYNFIEVGNTRKATGFDGAIRLEIQPQYISDLRKAKAIFIETGFEILPYFPMSIKDDGELIARFDDVLDRETATSIAGKPVYLREEEVSIDRPKPEVTDYDLSALIGTIIHDENLGKVGPIQSIESYPQQEIMIVEYNDGTVMIPLHPDLIIELIPGDRLVMCLPDGILEI